MPKNKGKGGKNRRRGKNESFATKRELVFKEAGQEYAQVVKMLGNGRLRAFCFDGKQRLCHIRGKMRKKVWVNLGDIILVGLRDYQDDKADVIMKYTTEEARNMKARNELPEYAKLNECDDAHEEGGVEFAEVGDESDGAGGDSDSDLMPSSGSESEDEDAGVVEVVVRDAKAVVENKNEDEDDEDEEEAAAEEEDGDSDDEDSEGAAVLTEEQLAAETLGHKPGARERARNEKQRYANKRNKRVF